ncbi:MAG: polysaccharide biosynthesis protein [bacterium]|nr:polysaccharide biosynthesis protein [bacterium]
MRAETTPTRTGRYLRREVQYALDLTVLAVSFALAYLLRFDFEVPQEYVRPALIQLPLVVLVQFGAMIALGIYSFVWRYVGMSEVKTFLRAAFYSSLPLLLLRLGLPDSLDLLRVPRSIILTDVVLAYGGLLALRVLRRALFEQTERIRRETESEGRRRKPVLLVGAGRAGLMAVREIRGRGDAELELIGFADDAAEKQGSLIGGLKVLGTTHDIARLVEEYNVEQVVITMADVAAATIRRIVESCDRTGIPVRIIPSYYEILDGRVSIARFREVQIEDLLGRDPVRLDEARIGALLTGKSVLLTGSGGSIGSELALQIARFDPQRLILVERAEGALFEIDREVRELWPQLEVHAFVADTGDADRIRAIMDRTRPHAVFHAAAHKHVPLMEFQASEAIKNNVFSTQVLAEAAARSGVEVFVLISTDKAVKPSSIMGASKRLAELIVQDLDREYPNTRFLAVRFGNVLGSAGSVVPVFRRQIERGGPVTVTHPDARRYFMTPAEAAQLVLEAGAIGDGGAILILDMGESVRILDLARDMIALSGFKPDTEIPIVFTGLRPGEKLNEELELSGEAIDRTSHPKVFIGKLEAYPHAPLEQILESFRELVRRADDDAIRILLTELLPEAALSRHAAPSRVEVEIEAESRAIN